MKLTEILPRFSGVRKTGNGYIAKCPTHEDKHQSLALAEGDGRTLLNCFAGCTADVIIASIGLRWSDLFDKAITKPAFQTLGQSYSSPVMKGYAPASDRKIQNVYTYVDEKGEVLYENVRYYPKDFRQRHFDAKGAPVWNLEGVRRVPYRLPQLLACIRQGADVFLCEGEKDTDAVRELGLTATNLKNWEDGFNVFVRNAHVIILQDHDLPGVQHAEKAARIISQAAASVKILDVFAEQEMAEKQGPDISDWIRTGVQDEGLTREELAERLAAIVERTPVWKDASGQEEFFVLKPANQWMTEAKETPVPKMLFGEFWFEGELCILFADTNVGKSILAVQVADGVSRGSAPRAAICPTPDDGRLTLARYNPAMNKPVPQGPQLVVETDAQKVVYFDFELTKKQFESRFAERVAGAEHYSNHYQFHPNFIRGEINPNSTDIGGFKCFEDFLNNALEVAVTRSQAKVLIIDNLTYLRDETENARNALPLMKFLKELKSKHGLSILTLAHTPKRDSAKPLGRNDLQGSKMLINFCDSSFAIGESQKDPGLRYLKQIKARNSEFIYHSENVLLASIQKQTNFLGFQFTGTGSERDHLRSPSDRDRDATITQVKELHAAGKSGKEIATELGISAASVSRYLKGA